MNTDYDQKDPEIIVVGQGTPTTMVYPIPGSTTEPDIDDRDLIDDYAPDPGLDNNNQHDPSKGAAIGAIGGGVVGALAGGPIGAVVGVVAGAIVSGAGVAAVDEIDNDYSPGERHADPATGATVVTQPKELV